MSPMEQQGQYGTERDRLRQLEGVERIDLLPLAEHVALTPGTLADEPAAVFIEWAPGAVERPFPGTAIWRAVLERFLRTARPDDRQWGILRPIIAGNLDRFPSLDAWLRWADHERMVARADLAAPGRLRPEPTLGIVWPW